MRVGGGTEMDRMVLGVRFEQALITAKRLHDGQRRKGSEIPYVAHLLAVASLVLEHGGNEDQAIAALLHDAVEDQGGLATLDRIRAEFGEEVADMVEQCSDAYEDPKPPWRQRKQAYLAALAAKSPEALLVSAADKLHNARAIVADYRDLGEDLWARFRGGKEGTLWYYRALADGLSAHGPARLAAELARVVDELEALAGQAD